MERAAQSDKRRGELKQAEAEAHELELAPELEVALDLKSVSALARNALAQFGDSPLAPSASIRLTTAGQSLTKDGCDLIEGAHIYLALRECPDKAIPFLLALAGMSDGDPDSYFKATDDQIAARLNCTARTVQEARKATKLWCRDTTFAVIQIREGDFDPVTGKNAPTEYRVPFVAGAEKVVKWSRSARRTSISQAGQKELKQFVDEHAKELPVEVVARARNRGKGKKAEEREPAEIQFTGRRNKVTYMIRKTLDAAATFGFDVRDIWRRMRENVDSYIEEKGY